MSNDRDKGNEAEIGIGMLGYAFMGKAHTNAYKKLAYMFFPPIAKPKLIAISGRNAEACSEAAQRYGYQKCYTDWHQLIEDDEVELFDNSAPNVMHAKPCIEAAKAGKHILCEKPLAMTSEEAKNMLEAVEKAGVKHMVSFNYRFVPAVRQIKELIKSGAFGQIYHWRAVYLQSGSLPYYKAPKSWRFDKSIAGSGSVGSLGSHIIDLAHYLIGGLKSVKAYTRTFIKERTLPENPKQMTPIDVDDAFVAAVEFENSALGTFESTRLAAGRRNYNSFEINCEKGSVRFNLERLNELDVCWLGSGPSETEGWTNVLMGEAQHPWGGAWWPSGHILGWEHTFIHEIDHFMRAIINNGDVAPHGATFYDGYRANVVIDAFLKSAETRRQVDIKY
jgi:predicted dehydrogenase